MNDLRKLLTSIDEELLLRRCFHPSERKRENARRRLELSLELRRLCSH